MSSSRRKFSQRLRDLPIATKFGGLIAMFVLSLVITLLTVATSFVVESGVRSYIGGESLWSKGQKDAVYSLARYLNTRDPVAWDDFQRAIAIPLGDRRARLEMQKDDYDPMVVREGFEAGMIPVREIPNMIFVFRNFGNVAFLADAIDAWRTADESLLELTSIASEVALANSIELPIDEAARLELLNRIYAINNRITPLAIRFSEVLTDGARQVQWTLLGLIAVSTSFLLGFSVLVAVLVSRDLSDSVERLRYGARRVASGDFGTRIPVRSYDEIGSLAVEFNDMIERRYWAEVALRTATDFREKIMENASNAIYTMDPEGRFMTANRRTCEITGYPLEELLGMTWVGMVPEEHLAYLFQRFTDTIEGREPINNYEIPLRRKDGSMVTIVFSIAPLRREGITFGVVGTAEDITARKRAEAELKARADELARSNLDLEQFAYVASHDLQEPLRTVSGFAQLLAKRYQGKLGAEADEYIAFVTSGVQRMKSLIEDLLSYSRVAREPTRGSLVDLNHAVTIALSNLRGAIEAADANIVLGPLPTLWVNQQQIVQLFQNLIGNALKFRSIRRPRVEIIAQLHAGEWLFTVRDNGIGIDEKYFEQVFGLFQRLHGLDQHPGNGIGLTICKKIVDLHQGRIWVESSKQGALFHFTLPAEDAVPLAGVAAR